MKSITLKTQEKLPLLDFSIVKTTAPLIMFIKVIPYFSSQDNLFLFVLHFILHGYCSLFASRIVWMQTYIVRMRPFQTFKYLQLQSTIVSLVHSSGDKTGICTVANIIEFRYTAI